MKAHVVLNDPKFKEGGKTQTLCGHEGKLHFENIFPAHWVLITKAATHLKVATSCNINDKSFCVNCRHGWRNATRGD